MCSVKKAYHYLQSAEQLSLQVSYYSEVASKAWLCYNEDFSVVHVSCKCLLPLPTFVSAFHFGEELNQSVEHDLHWHNLFLVKAQLSNT